jgi:CRP-like cAMP-binding protein
MKNFYSVIKKCPLFEDIDYKSIDIIFSEIDYQIKKYDINEIIYLEDDICNELSIILEGKITIQSISSSGEVFTVLQFSKENIFGEGLIFSDLNYYPITVVTSSNETEILTISKENLIKAFSINNKLTTSFMKMISNRITLLNDKVKILALQSIRKKICFFILKKYKIIKSNKIDIGMNKKTLAEHLAIPRPSLSRELINMKKDRLIDYDKNFFYILDLKSIENILYN